MTSLVVRSEPAETPSEFADCYDPNTNSYNQSCIDSVMAKYLKKPEEVATVKSLYDAVQKSLAKLTPTEEKMEQVKEESQVQEPVEEVQVVEPAPVEKAKMDKKEEVEEEDETKEKSGLDATFESLKSMLAEGKSPEDIQKVFNNLGKEVEKNYKRPAPTTEDIANVVKSALDEALRPMAVEIATLKAQLKSGEVAARNEGVVASKAISGGYGVKPEDLLRNVPQQPTKKLTQIEEIALKSTGAMK